ncbi:hypothetical protein SAMN04488168_1337 [Bacillus sp. 491mf]|nr:hypothetical protein SAMN04488168_1337 [Bacillus sp. 491mf]
MKLYEWSKDVQEMCEDSIPYDPFVFSLLASLSGFITYMKK